MTSETLKASVSSLRDLLTSKQGWRWMMKIMPFSDRFFPRKRHPSSKTLAQTEAEYYAELRVRHPLFKTLAEMNAEHHAELRAEGLSDEEIIAGNDAAWEDWFHPRYYSNKPDPSRTPSHPGS